MEDIRISYIGDSFINGVGDSYMLGWAGRLSLMSRSEKREITHYNLGVRRDTSSDILRRWESEADARSPKSSINCAIFSFGVNDTEIEDGKPRVSLVNSMTNIREILGLARVNYNVLMIGPPPIDDPKQNERIKSYDNAYITICNMFHIPYLSLFDRLIEDEVWMREIRSYDGTHPRDEGYELIARHIYEWEAWWF